MYDLVSYILQEAPKGVTYEITGATEDPFRDQELATRYRNQLKTKTQYDGESLQEFSATIELVTNHSLPTRCGDHISWEPIKAFDNGTSDKRCKMVATPMMQENTQQDPRTEPRSGRLGH
jgi:hypothetical protein